MQAVRSLFKAPQPISGATMWAALVLSVLPFLVAVVGPVASDLHHIANHYLATH
jgi:hypothetical protein